MHALKQYSIVTLSYWAFTITDGALRMLLVLYFHHLGFSPFEIAMMFILYECFGVITNLLGGWIAAHLGLNKTMHIGILLQIITLAMLLPQTWLTVPYIMATQALSGIAKDLNKMSAKSSIKTLIPQQAQNKLYKWVAILTGSKNALKGVGFFMGALLLALFGFQQTLFIMAIGLAIILIISYLLLDKNMGKMKYKPKFTTLFSKSSLVNRLSMVRFFLFGARDVWFVVALPVYLEAVLGWDFMEVGAFLALWVIGYGFIQSIAPIITGLRSKKTPNENTVVLWSSGLALILITICVSLYWGFDANIILIAGLLIFGVLFAINSSIHSYLIVSYAKADGVSLDVGFYYMANAAGRLVGTILSGAIYQYYGFIACLLTSMIFILLTSIISKLNANKTKAATLSSV